MIDRERVIKGLLIERECVSRDCDRDCGKCDLVQDRDWLLSVYDDALALLKEQEHGEKFTVIDTKTGKEADEYNIALHEDWAKHLCYCDMEGWAIENDGTLLLVDECGRFAYADRERFKVVWDA